MSSTTHPGDSPPVAERPSNHNTRLDTNTNAVYQKNEEVIQNQKDAVPLAVSIADGFTNDYTKATLELYPTKFQGLVEAYKKLPAPPDINVELEFNLVIEVEEVPSPEIDYTTVKQYLRTLPLSKGPCDRRAREEEQTSTLILDFRFLKEKMPSPVPKITTTYVTRSWTRVTNEWHFMLVQFKNPSYGLGILIFLPGTGLRYFIDINVVIPDDNNTKSSGDDSFRFPLDLIVWQLFDFFTTRVISDKLELKQGFAPLSLRCADRILGIIISRFFLRLGLPAERQVKVSEYQQIPIEYSRQAVNLPNRTPKPVPLVYFRALFLCPYCLKFFARTPQFYGSICRYCTQLSKSAEAQATTTTGADSIQFKVARPSLSGLFYYSLKRGPQIVNKRKQGDLFPKGPEDQRDAKKLRET